MARTLLAVFESVYRAELVAWELRELGVSGRRIFLIPGHIPDKWNELDRLTKVRPEVMTNELRTGATIGLGIGGSLSITGGLLIGLGPLHLPAFLTSLVSGPESVVILILIAALVSMGACAFTGRLIGGAVGLGIPEEEILQYAKNVSQGSVTLIAIPNGDALDGAFEILVRYCPLDLRQKSVEWRKARRQEELDERESHVQPAGRDRSR